MKHLIEKYGYVKNSVPADYTIKAMRVTDVISSSRAFLTEFFEGALAFSAEPLASGFVSISPSGFTYLTKLLLNEIYAESAEVELSFSRESVTFNIFCLRELCARELIIKTAALTGFALEKSTPEKIILHAKITPSARFTVYAGRGDILRVYFNQIFFF